MIVEDDEYVEVAVARVTFVVMTLMLSAVLFASAVGTMLGSG